MIDVTFRKINPWLMKAHPMNEGIYRAWDEEHTEDKGLIESVKTNGILVPIVVAGSERENFMTILSGHRRWRAAMAALLTEVPFEYAMGDKSDKEYIIEYNRYRAKTPSEIMREAEVAFEIIMERSKANRGQEGKPKGTVIPEEEKVNTYKEVAEMVGLKPTTFKSLKVIFEKAEEFDGVKDKIKKMDAGELSIYRVWKSVRSLGKDMNPNDIPDFIKFFNNWHFSEPDVRFGISHPGRTAGQVVGNLIYYYTEPGDLIIDPMAGGGSTGDVAEFLGRECIMMDLAPKRPDIRQHDISNGYPPDIGEPQLIFLDPPYWNMKSEAYTDESVSNLGLKDFEEWLYGLIKNSYKILKSGGFLALISGQSYFRLPHDFKGGYIDWPVYAWDDMQSAGFTAWARIGVTLATSQHTGADVEAAKEGKFFLPIQLDIVIGRKL